MKLSQNSRLTVQEAVARWAIALEGLVEFEEVPVVDAADITVLFAKKNHSCYEVGRILV